MQRFVEQTLISDYIKALMSTTPLPKYKSVSDGDYIVENCRYIYNNHIISCKTSGRIGISGSTATYAMLYEYVFGDSIDKLTSKFTSIYDYYDSTTHERLGEYLRLYRDTYGIDLMPFYNCYSNRFSSSFYISDYGTILQQLDNKFKIISIPIKFNTTYTIAIDSDSTIKLAPAFICNGDFLFIGDANITQNFEKISNQSKTLPSSEFLAPFTYKVTNTRRQYEQYERYLTLFIQIPVSCTSSIAVLEGDYTDCSIAKTISLAGETSQHVLESKTNKELNELFIYKPMLLKMNDRVSYPFSDRLVEYLLGNVITNVDDVENNIKRIQDKVNIKQYYSAAIKDVWDVFLRKVLFDKYLKDNPGSYDINGFVDKNVEKYINGVV